MIVIARFVVAAGAVLLVAGCAGGSTPVEPDTEEQVATTAPNPGSVFDGTYQVVQEQEVRPDVSPPSDAYGTASFSVTSFCPDATGPCVASVAVTYPDLDPMTEPQFQIIDYADGRWTIVSDGQSTTCTTESGETLTADATWQSATLEQRAGITDGSVLTGKGITYIGSPCAKDYFTTYTLTRTGPVDPAVEVPSPRDIPALVDAPGTALVGNYDIALNPVSSGSNRQADPAATSGRFTSFCARTGDACVAVFDGGEEFPSVLEWSDGTWTTNATYAVRDCAGSGTETTSIRASMTRSDSSDGAAQTLSGELVKTVVGDCPSETVWSIAATRTGG